VEPGDPGLEHEADVRPPSGLSEEPTTPSHTQATAPVKSSHPHPSVPQCASLSPTGC
jgi:hypothetical protein